MLLKHEGKRPEIYPKFAPKSKFIKTGPRVWAVEKNYILEFLTKYNGYIRKKKLDLNFPHAITFSICEKTSDHRRMRGTYHTP